MIQNPEKLVSRRNRGVRRESPEDAIGRDNGLQTMMTAPRARRKGPEQKRAEP